MKEINPQELKEKINLGEKFVVDFYATWCGPCKMMLRVLEEHHSKFGVPVYKFNIENDRQLSMDYGIRSVPTIIFFNESKVQKKHVGILTENQFNSFTNL
jgi:thioredoxin 1